MLWTTRVLKALQELVALANSILKVLRLRQPGMVFVKVVSEGVNGMLKFKLVLPAAGASDVVARKLVIGIGTADPVTEEVAGGVLESSEYSGEDGATVAGTLIDVDDAGNESTPSAFSFVLVDTIPPPQPGEVGLVVTADE
jgi:hypothetical protein